MTVSPLISGLSYTLIDVLSVLLSQTVVPSGARIDTLACTMLFPAFVGLNLHVLSFPSVLIPSIVHSIFDARPDGVVEKLAFMVLSLPPTNVYVRSGVIVKFLIWGVSYTLIDVLFELFPHSVVPSGARMVTVASILMSPASVGINVYSLPFISVLFPLTVHSIFDVRPEGVIL